ASRPVHGLLGLRIAQGVSDRGERLVELVHGLPERLVQRLALNLGGRDGIAPLLPVVLAEPPAQLGELLTDVVPRPPGFLLAAPRLLAHVEPPSTRLPCGRRRHSPGASPS